MAPVKKVQARPLSQQIGEAAIYCRPRASYARRNGALERRSNPL